MHAPINFPWTSYDMKYSDSILRRKKSVTHNLFLKPMYIKINLISGYIILNELLKYLSKNCRFIEFQLKKGGYSERLIKLYVIKIKFTIKKGILKNKFYIITFQSKFEKNLKKNIWDTLYYLTRIQ